MGLDHVVEGHNPVRHHGERAAGDQASSSSQSVTRSAALPATTSPRAREVCPRPATARASTPPGARNCRPAAKDYPHLLQMVTEQVVGHDYTYGQEYSFGLDLVLDGLQTHPDRLDHV